MSQEHAQAKGRRRSSTEVSELVAEYLTSVLTQTEFCRKRKTNYMVDEPNKLCSG